MSKITENRQSRVIGKSDVYTATLNSINTLVGSGILVLPYVLVKSGLVLGIITFIVALVSGLYSTGLLIQCKNICGFDSYSAIGHASYGRNAIFIVSGTTTILCIGMPIAYFIIVSDAITPILMQHLGTEIGELELRTIVVILLSILLAYYCVKREMHELRGVSFASTICALIFE